VQLNLKGFLELFILSTLIFIGKLPDETLEQGRNASQSAHNTKLSYIDLLRVWKLCVIMEGPIDDRNHTWNGCRRLG